MFTKRGQSENLAKRFQDGDRKALEELCGMYTDSIRRSATRYARLCNSSVSVDDLMQEGLIALMEAAENFEFDSKYHYFSQYALNHINNSIQFTCFSQGLLIRMSKRACSQIASLLKAREACQQLTGREKTLAIADYMNMRESRITALLEIMNYFDIESIDELDDDQMCDAVFAEDVEDMIEKSSVHDTLFELMDTKLTEREKNVLMMRFGFTDRPHTLAEVGIVYGLLAESIRRIERKAIMKLKGYIKIKNLASSLQ